MLDHFSPPAFLYKMDPESSHNLVLESARLLPILGKLGAQKPSKKLQLKFNKLDLISPLGLAAGLDKNAQALLFWKNQGFGFCEVGTITHKAQDGNPKPRVFRLEDHSLLNAMGFPNLGMNTISENILAQKNIKLPLGINLGKNKLSSPLQALEEYSTLYKHFSSYCDYITINLSSPNTKGLRDLQNKDWLQDLSQKININNSNIPTFIKIAPDFLEQDLLKLVDDIKNLGFNGIIATNTSNDHSYSSGGISGRMLATKSFRTQEIICSTLKTNDSFFVMGVGGIENFKQILDFWLLGGGPVQIYTSYVYQGPKILKNIYHEIQNWMKKHKIDELQDFFNLTKVDRKKYEF